MAAPLGNQNAHKKRMFEQAVQRAIAGDEGKRLRASAERLLDLAESGERWAVEVLRDTLDGKPSQQVAIVGDEDAAPVQLKAMIEFVGREVATSDDDDSRRAVEPADTDRSTT